MLSATGRMFGGLTPVFAVCLVAAPLLVAFAEPDPPAVPGKTIIEAEDASGMEFPFEIRRNQSASGGMSVGVPEGKGKPPEAEGVSSYDMEIAEQGNYFFWVRKWWMDGCGNSVKLGVDNSPLYTVGEDGTYKHWDWVRCSVAIQMDAGKHRLLLHNNEDGAWIDQILVTMDEAYVPQGRETAGAAEEADIYFADDFMREKKQAGVWKPAAGEWEISTTKDPERSSNAFHYRSKGDGERLSTAGYPFWRDYSVEASAMSLDSADIGLVFLMSEDSEYYLWRIPVTSGRGMRLVRRSGETEEVLFEVPKHLRARQWYRLRATVCRGTILLEIDGDQVAKVTDYGHLKGRFGLFSKGAGETLFDDIVTRSVGFLSDDFADVSLSGWETKGEFRAYTELDRNIMRAVLGGGFSSKENGPDGKFPFLAALGEGSAGTGTADWHDYELSFDVRPESGAEWSLVMGAGEGNEGQALSFRSEKAGLFLSCGGPEEETPILCEWPGRWHKVLLDNRDGAVRLVLDGEKVFEESLPGTKGKLTLSVVEGDVFFDNVVVRHREKLAPEAVITEQFTKESTMESWASSGHMWEKDENEKELWSRFDFHGNVELGYDFPADLQNSTTFMMGIASGNKKPRTGCRMIISKGKIDLAEPDGAASSASLDTGSIKSCALKRIGGDLTGYVNGKAVVTLKTKGGHAQSNVWVAIDKGSVDPNALIATGDSSVNYLMSAAPVDWRVSNGEFNFTNRWKCDPRWSWAALMSPAESIMWNKKSFSGDISMDMFASMRMERTRTPQYGDPGDLNLTICADGRSLGSGYSLIFGGYDNTATRLLRKGDVVAETAEHLAPSTRHRLPPNEGEDGLHRRWFHVAMKKTESVVRCFLDGKEILTYEDPEPLTGRKVAAWSFDNGIMISLLRISADEIGACEFPLVDDVLHKGPASGPAVAVGSETHPFMQFDFEEGRQNWGPRRAVDHFAFDWEDDAWEIEEDNSREVSVTAVSRSDGGTCIEVGNTAGGGTFAVEVPIIGLDLMKMPILSFDYAIPADVFVNLYVKIDGVFRCVAITGKPRSVSGATLAGSIDANADGGWHSARANLRDLLLGLMPGAEKLVVEDAFIGNMDNTDYLVCGIGGNPGGSAYRLDNVSFLSPGPSSGEISWVLEDGEVLMADVMHLFAVAPSEEAAEGNSYVFKGLADGRWLLRLRQEKKGAVSKLVPFEVDTNPPVIVDTLPWTGREFRILVSDGEGSGIDPNAIEVKAGTEAYTVEHPALSYDPRKGMIDLDPVRAGMQFRDGEFVEVRVSKLSDFLGNSLSEAPVLTWLVDFKKDVLPPPNLSVIPPADYLVNNDFESDTGQWRSDGGKLSPELKRHRGDTAGGEWCLEVFSEALGGDFTCGVYSGSYEAGKFPMVSFDYKITEDIDVDFRFLVDERWKYVRFADENSGNRPTGKIEDIKENGEWQHASFNLYQMLTKDDPYADNYDVQKIQLGDWGWRGCRKGARFYIDNFRIEPACGVSKSLQWQWSGVDPSGISEVRWSSLGESWQKVRPDAASWGSSGHTDGYVPLTVKASDPSGNWSIPATAGVLYDGSPPKISADIPKNSARTAANVIWLKVVDSVSGVDKKSIRFTTGGRTFTVDDEELVYNYASSRLVFNGWASGTDIFFDDGLLEANVSLSDHAGNKSKLNLEWTMDRMADKTPPSKPFVGAVVTDAVFKEGFEGDEKEWRKKFELSGARYDAIARNAATGRRCLAVYNTYQGHVRITPKLPDKLKISDCPMLIFDCKMDEDAKFNVYLKTNGKDHRIEFTEKEMRHYPKIGEMPEGTDDGKWHRVEFNLMELLKANDQNPNVQLKSLSIENATNSNPKKAWIYLDNICLAKPQRVGDRANIEWTELVDHTGLDRYSFCLDGEPKTEIVEEEVHETAMSLEVPGKGPWYFHIRGTDGAGNSGEITHFRVK